MCNGKWISRKSFAVSGTVKNDLNNPSCIDVGVFIGTDLYRFLHIIPEIYLAYASVPLSFTPRLLLVMILVEKYSPLGFFRCICLRQFLSVTKLLISKLI
ncbi:hypothetical protein SC81_21575 [Vibrio vulnificus]|nr:hypothetical protein SC81_21575 [Vibrio vulnificus]